MLAGQVKGTVQVVSELGIPGHRVTVTAGSSRRVTGKFKLDAASIVPRALAPQQVTTAWTRDCEVCIASLKALLLVHIFRGL